MDAIQIQAGGKQGQRPEAAVIWLHGLGADGHDFEPIVPELELSKPVRFVFPHAPMRPVTINNGMRMRAWYDIYQFGGGREDDAGLRESQKLVEEMIRAQGMPPGKIVLAGFSQGGAIVLQTGLRQAERLAGIMALSCYLPIASTVAAERNPASQSVPVFMAHGRFDDVIPMQRAQASREALEKMGYPVEWHEYPMPHSVCAEEIADISAFLSKVI